MATANTKIKNQLKKITRLHKERSAHFNDEDESKYWSLNRQLQGAKTQLDRFMHWCTVNMINMDAELDIVPSGYGCVRFESLTDEQQSRIFKLEYAFDGGHLYATRNGLARSLKDAVHNVTI